jgi:alpha-mannosidase
LEPVAPAHPVHVEEPGAGPVVVTNGLVTVTVDDRDGTFSLEGVAGYGRLVDGGDHGDSYNYSPPAGDRIVDTPDDVTVTVTDRGPVRAVASVTAHYTWPDHVDGATRARTGAVGVEVTTDIEVRADERIVRVVTRFVNPASDHRLRVHFPLPEPAEGSDAECAFAVVHRGLDAEGRTDEFGLPTFPSRRFVSAGGLTVAHEGLLEYELVDIEGEPSARRATAMAVTLLRSTGMLSRLGMAYRPLPAGPLTPVEGLQLRGRTIEARYALGLGCDDPYAMVDDAFVPLEVVYAPGGGWRPGSGSALEIEGAEVSAVRRQAGMLEVRVFNPTDRPVTVGVGARSGWLVDLRGGSLEPVDGSFALRPFGIATFRSPG